MPLEAEPGDVLLHSTGVLHGSPPNVSTSARRAFYVHYRSLDELGRGYWRKSSEWLDAQRAFLRSIIEERGTAGLPAG